MLPSSNREAVLAVVDDFRQELGAVSARAPWLNLELWLKLAAEALLPARPDAGVPPVHAVQTAMRQIDALRHLAPPHDAALAAHLAQTDMLLRSAHACSRVDWPRLHGELLAWLARWQQEIDATGDIEDEDRDPVGEPLR